MKRWAWFLVALAGCSDIAGTRGGVVALEILLPTPPAIEPDDTLTLRARGIDANGREVTDAPIIWTSPDTALHLDSVTGKASTTLTGGPGLRVQARTGSLLSDVVSLEIHRRSDTLALPGLTTLTVAAADSASEALVAAVQSLTPDTAGIGNTRILYEVVDTAAARGNVRFSGNTLALRVPTGSDGTPATPVTLRRVPGGTAPATVEVRVSATRPSGISVPGSGQIFTINFQ